MTKSEASNLKNIVKISDVILDGKMDDPIWTDEVKAKKYEFRVKVWFLLFTEFDFCIIIEVIKYRSVLF